ncbi:hypothetical protein GCM10009799_32990 [Nocardiopsis rhodophaea]|uniref:Hint domain-containing protein n=2 Tax=Nocardiopsis rhodophaea TaxID=280238 RepID=A0ABN2TAB4_9ACTN
MRWVWRAETGAFKVEYAALVILVATVATAVLAFGLPTQTRAFYESALCRIGKSEYCEELDLAGDGGRSDSHSPGGSSDPGEGSPPEAPTPDGSKASEGPPNDPSDGSESSDSADAGDESADDQTEPAGYTIANLNELSDAESELNDAKEELTGAQGDTDDLYDQLLEILADIVGFTDAKACVTEGDIAACLWTIIGFTPWGKGAKLARKLPKILDAWRTWRRTRRGIQKAKDKVTDARQAVRKAGRVCKRNSFVSGTPVLLGDGKYLPIEKVRVGERVLATNAETGDSSAAWVTETISTTGVKEVVEVSVLGPDGGEAISVTEGHLFLSDGRWTTASDLRPGSMLRHHSGATVSVLAIGKYVTHASVHDLTVEGVHTYYVGEGGASVLVHNSDACPNIDVLKQNSQKPAKGPGKTQAGRAYQKHRDRGELDDVPNSQLKDAGQNLMEEILNNPDTQVLDVTSGNAKGGVRFVMPRSGKRDIGVTFDAQGNLLYFGLY